MIWVIDASVALRWYLKDEAHQHADRVLRRLLLKPEEFAVPELFGFELLSVLARMTDTADDIFKRGVMPILNGGILRYPMTEELASGAITYVKRGLTGYDAVYVALADLLNGKWLTFDSKAHRKIAGLNRSVLLSRTCPIAS